MKRRLAVLAVLLGVVATIVACGGGGGASGGGSDSASQDGGNGGSGAGGGKLQFFDHDSFANPGGEALIAAYEKKTGTKISIAKMPPGDAQPVIKAQLAGGTAADIMTLATNQQTWPDLDKGWWMDLTKYANAPNPYVPGSKRWIDGLTPGAAAQLKFADGKIYALSTTGFDVGFIYNKDVFNKLGISVPTTFAELVADLQKAKAGGYIPLVWELGDHEYGGQAPQFLTILEGTVLHDAIAKMDANHDKVVDVKELVKGVRDGTYSANNPDYQESWKILKSLQPYFQLGASAATGSSQGFNTFKSGRAAMWFEGSFNSSDLDQTKIDWGAFQMPKLTADTTQYATDGPQPTGGFGACCGFPWAVPVTTDKHGKTKLAIDFLYWLSAPENTQKFADNAGVLSVLKGAKVSPKLQAFADAANNVSPLSGAELSFRPQFIQTRSRLAEQYLTGSLSLEAAMAQMQKEMEASADQAAKQFGVD
jgi:ABC-type glycerol-3-phosphate transport system substrate-binding protein